MGMKTALKNKKEDQMSFIGLNQHIELSRERGWKPVKLL